MLVCSLLTLSGVSFPHKDLVVHASVKFAIDVYKRTTTLKCWECSTLAEQYPMLFFFFAIYRAKCSHRDRCDISVSVISIHFLHTILKNIICIASLKTFPDSLNHPPHVMFSTPPLHQHQSRLFSKILNPENKSTVWKCIMNFELLQKWREKIERWLNPN